MALLDAKTCLEQAEEILWETGNSREAEGNILDIGRAVIFLGSPGEFRACPGFESAHPLTLASYVLCQSRPLPMPGMIYELAHG
jgi:hypothetical protein